MEVFVSGLIQMIKQYNAMQIQYRVGDELIDP